MGITQIIKRNGETIQLNTNEPFCFVKEATLTSSLMGDDYISLKIVSSEWLSFAKGDKIIVGGNEYSIRATTTREIVSEGYYNYEPVFYGVMYDLMKTIYRNCDKYGKSDKSTFDLTYTIKEFVQVLIYNLERDYPGVWKFDEDNCPETEAKTIQFSGVNCLQALQTLCNSEQFNLEFQITQDNGIRTIHIGKFGKRINPPSGADFFEWGNGNGLYNLKEQKIDDKAIITRLWVEGGTTNIRSDYRGYAERLQLPMQRMNQYDHTLADGTVVKANTEMIGISDESKRYIENAELRDKIGSEEDVKTYDNIYPKRTGKVTAVVADDICAFVDDTMDFDLNKKDDKGTVYLVDGVSAKITFTSGRLAGQQFELNAKGGYDDKTKTFKIIPFTDNRGLTIPSEETKNSFFIEVGNTYKITDIYLPEQYEKRAEEDLWYAGSDDFKDASQVKAQYALTFDRLYFLQSLSSDTDTSVFAVGDYVPVKDTRFGIEKTMRIQKITRNLLLEHDYQITLADTTAVSIQTQTVLTVIEHENIINNNRLRDLNKARRGWRTTEDLRNMVYDTDGYFDTDNIKPNSIDTNMLTVGAKSQQFVLSGCVLQANFGGNPNMFVATAGILSHLTIDNDKIRNWQMNEASFKLQSTGGYYLFAKCSKSGENGVWYLTQEQLKFEPTSDPNNYYFQVGIVSSLYADDNFRDFQTTYGFTRINGNTITTGRIITSDGECYLDLEGNKFRIGDSTSSIDWNVSAKSRLTLKNVSVASGSGDVVPLGVYRGVWNKDYIYYTGDEVAYTSNGATCTYRYIHPTPTKGNLPTNSTYWEVVAQGADGISGNNGDWVSFVFKHSETKPATPTSTAPIPDGWSDTPSATGKWWMSKATINGVTGKAGKWSEPVQTTAEDGVNGAYTDFKYAKNTSSTSFPAITVSDRNPSGWSDEPPTLATGEYLWMSQAEINADGTLKTNWSTPVRISGEKGKSPALVYRGVYDSSKTYYGNQYRVDAVIYNGIYYVARIDAGEFYNVAPTNTSKWNNFGAQFESIATGLLLAENANIAGFIFRNNRLESSLSDANGQPNIILDGVSGNSRFSGILKASLYYGSMKKITDATNREYQIDPQKEAFNGFFIDEPTNIRFVTLPKAKDYDGLEIKIYTKQSHWTPDRWTVVQSQSTDDFYVKLGNIYNVYDANDKKYVAALENYMTPYTNIKGTGCAMIPNVMHTFKSMNGAWFSIQGLYTGE